MDEPAIQTQLRRAYTPERTVLEKEWQFLVGFEVDVRFRGRLLRTGVVDAATADGSIAWLARQGVQERVLLAKDECYELWVTGIDDRRIRVRKENASREA